MERSKSFSIEVFGELAMFTTPQSKLSCERISYPMPTYSSLVGILERVYYKPGIKWVVEKCRVLSPIDYERISILSPSFKFTGYEKRMRYVYLYLKKPRYQIQAHYEKDNHFYGRPDYHLGHDKRIEGAIQYGGRDMIRLGSGNCVGYYKGCEFGSGEGYYDTISDIEPVYMFYEFIKSQKTNEIKKAGFWFQEMKNGIIEFDNRRVCYREWKKS
ncbi:type I-C CRISPR-associated protein Cas5c [Pseudobutyrivibrio sp. LB2011]|uniref:type I-C CRISPR-associated protein Cas5c n=1 Tax=Pseudobutyrivibrio sp. LB2011 TaxID=1408312 RepID=UPI0005D2C3A0|nr:type I-C CRISPR-associated protein Cas5c [Pseudobutyrivibrio sp. LB2011]